jgi:hypothetical protein
MFEMLSSGATTLLTDVTHVEQRFSAYPSKPPLKNSKEFLVTYCINNPRHSAAEPNLSVFGYPVVLKSLINLAVNVLARGFGTGIVNANIEALQIAV